MAAEKFKSGKSKGKGNLKNPPVQYDLRRIVLYILMIYTFLVTQFAKLFRNGSSQAVRLPREFRFEGDRVRIRRSGNSVILEPIIDDPKEWLASLKSIPADPDFMKNRNQPKTPKRRIFE